MLIKNIFRPSTTTHLLNLYISHIAFFYFVFVGSWQEWLIAFAIYIFRFTIGATITLHRLLSHRSFTAPKWFEYFGSIVSIVGSSVSTIAWVAIHREHHKFADAKQDPHSPVHNSPISIQFRTTVTEPKIRYVPDLIRSKFHVMLHQYHWAVSIIFFLLVLAIDPLAVFYAYFVPNVIYGHSGGFINSINHMFGYRTYNTGDNSTNNLFTGYLIAGEGWHNNHHNSPGNPNFGEKWWEFDLGWQVIKLIRK